MQPDILAAHSVAHGVLQRPPLDDEGQLAQSGVVGAEVETGARVVAVDTHGFDAGDAFLRNPRPCPAVLEERDRPRAQRVDAVVPGCCAGGALARGLRLDQRQLQPAAGESAREAQADEPAADDEDVATLGHLPPPCFHSPAAAALRICAGGCALRPPSSGSLPAGRRPAPQSRRPRRTACASARRRPAPSGPPARYWARPRTGPAPRRKASGAKAPRWRTFRTAPGPSLPRPATRTA